MVENRNRTSRNEIIFVIVLVIIGIGALTATLLHACGIWFNDATARIVYRIFWVFAWLPGMAMAFMLLLRGKSIISMTLSMLLQATALVLYQISSQLINQAGALGFLGLGMPWLLSITRLELKKQCLELLLLLGLPLLVFFDKDGDAWAGAAIPLVFFWAGYAASIWPGVDAILKQLLEQEKPQREKSRLALWFNRILIALAIVAMLFVVVILIISHHYRFFIQEHLLP
jgi:hypothetical protein